MRTWQGPEGQWETELRWGWGVGGHPCAMGLALTWGVGAAEEYPAPGLPDLANKKFQRPSSI